MLGECECGERVCVEQGPRPESGLSKNVCILERVSLRVSVDSLGSVLGSWNVSMQAQNWHAHAYQPV